MIQIVDTPNVLLGGLNVFFVPVILAQITGLVSRVKNWPRVSIDKKEKGTEDY
jgi:hypothetical protein